MAETITKNERADDYPGILVRGVLQLFDIYDNRCDLWECSFYIPDEEAKSLTPEELELLYCNNRLHESADYNLEENDASLVLWRLVKSTYDRGELTANCGCSSDLWEWGDPLELTAYHDDIAHYCNLVQSGS